MDNLSDDIIKYKKGLLSAKEMHALEKKALDDPFLAEALEGSDLVSTDEFANDVQKLNSKIISKRRIIFTPLRIAAGILLMTASVFLIYQVIPKKENIALNQPKNQEQKPITQPEEKKSEVVKEKETNATQPKKIAKAAEPKREVKKEVTSNPQPEVVAQNDLAVTEIVESKTNAEIKEEKEINIVSAPVVKDLSREEFVENKADKKVARALHYSTQGAGLAKQAMNHAIIGIVVSSEDNSAIPGVNVVIKGTTNGTVTDASGSFSLSTNENNPVLDFSFIGFQTKEIETQGQNSFVVKLENDVTQLSEVVVTNTIAPAADADATIIYAEPEGGKKAYNKYLESNMRYPQEALKNNVKGKVRIEFALHPDGSFDQYKIVKSIGSGCDEELMRLIKEGPKWKPTTVNGRAIESKVRVGLRFDPAKSGR